jgi:hypothetical protein
VVRVGTRCRQSAPLALDADRRRECLDPGAGLAVPNVDERGLQELWSVETRQTISGANPITYMGKDGKQYVTVAAGTTLLSYSLP